MKIPFLLASALLLASGAALAQGQMGTSSTGQPSTGWSGGTAPGSSPAQSSGNLNMGAGQTQGTNARGDASAQSKQLEQKMHGQETGAVSDGKNASSNVPAAANGGAGGSTSLHGQVNSESGAQPNAQPKQ